MSAPRILVAGLGNVFLGDDGFGAEVVAALARHRFPADVQVTDFGIRGFDLAFAILDDPEVIVLVDALPRGELPGTVSLVEVPVCDDGSVGGLEHDGAFEGHTMTPSAIFALVQSMGGRPRRVLVVGCEPATLGPEGVGQLGLSDVVAAAVPLAVELCERVVGDLLAGRPIGERTGGDGAGASAVAPGDDHQSVTHRGEPIPAVDGPTRAR